MTIDRTNPFKPLPLPGNSFKPLPLLGKPSCPREENSAVCAVLENFIDKKPTIPHLPGGKFRVIGVGATELATQAIEQLAIRMCPRLLSEPPKNSSPQDQQNISSIDQEKGDLSRRFCIIL